MATEFPIDPEYNRFVDGEPDDAGAEQPQPELNLDNSEIEELPDGSAIVRMEDRKSVV